ELFGAVLEGFDGHGRMACRMAGTGDGCLPVAQAIGDCEAGHAARPTTVPYLDVHPVQERAVPGAESQAPQASRCSCGASAAACGSSPSWYSWSYSHWPP